MSESSPDPDTRLSLEEARMRLGKPGPGRTDTHEIIDKLATLAAEPVTTAPAPSPRAEAFHAGMQREYDRTKRAIKWGAGLLLGATVVAAGINAITGNHGGASSAENALDKTRVAAANARYADPSIIGAHDLQQSITIKTPNGNLGADEVEIEVSEKQDPELWKAIEADIKEGDLRLNSDAVRAFSLSYKDGQYKPTENSMNIPAVLVPGTTPSTVKIDLYPYDNPPEGTAVGLYIQESDLTKDVTGQTVVSTGYQPVEGVITSTPAGWISTQGEVASLPTGTVLPPYQQPEIAQQ